MIMKKLLVYIFCLVAFAASAQTTTRIKLTQIEKSNTVNGTKANQVPVSNGVGDLRYSQYTEINPTPIGYTPAATGNPSANYAQFVTPANGDVWYIDNEGRGIRLYVAASAGDYDWLEIGNNMIPNSINDSIYKYKYASVGGRLVWPTAEMLVIDSVAQGMFIVAGDRKAKIALYDTNNQTWCTLEQGGGTTALIMQDGGVFSIQTAGSGTPQAPGTPIVEHFNVLGDSSIQFPQYPNTRTDAGTPTKLWGPDATGKMKNYAVSALPVTLPANVAYRDSVNTFTRNQIISNASASLIPALSLTGNWGNGFGVNTRPHLLLAPSGVTQNANWSASGTGIGLNAISGYTGRFIEFQVNGSSQFLIGASGQIYSNAPTGYSGAVLELLINASNRFAVTSNGAIFFGSNAGKSIQPIDASNTTSSSGAGIRISGGFTSEINSAQIRFGNGNGNRNPTSGTSDFININETFAAPAGSANYRPISINYTINNSGVQTGAATGLYINATETTLNGMTHNLMDLQVAGASQTIISRLGAITTNGAIQSGSNITAGSNSALRFLGKTELASPVNGNLLLRNTSQNGFGLIQLGDITNLFPAIKRNGTTIETRLADDSNFAGAQSLYNRFGSGSPEGVVTAPVGTIYNRIDGTTGTSAYIKESGTGNTGWVAVAPGGGGITGTISSGQIAVGSGANAIGGSSALTYTGNKLQINPTYTSGASGDAGVLILGTTTGSGTVGHRVVGTSISPTTVAGANDQVLNAFEINAAFTNGIFTGVTNNIFAVREGGNNKFSVSSTGGASVEQLYARGNPTTVSYVSASGTSGTATRNYGGDLAFNMTFQAGGTPSISDYIEITFATPLPTGTKPIVTWKECSGTDLELIYKMYTSEIQKSNTKFRFYFQVAPPSTSRTFDVHVIGG